ncbi:MAG: radical SAM family heme chaperone HemW [Acidobacteria bacterium]|nr:radical SAM family heme chaperone HemW [Acidobacteriota bacterium]
MREIADSRIPDSRIPDFRIPDFEIPDFEIPDSRITDSGIPDSRIPDFRIPDSGIPDSRIPDSRILDFEIPDSGIPDFERIGSKSEIPNPKSQIATVYFGGGTPSLLTAKQLEKIFEAIRRRFEVAENAEVTLEMNPATVTLEKLLDFKALGVNRASFGVQTFDDKALKMLARGHDANDARKTLRLLRKAGFDNISFDLIAGLPDQSLAGWKRNLKEALELSPEHLSLYLLEIHEGTPLAEQLRSNRRPMPDEDLAGEMYETMIGMTAAAGFKHYEISNFARPGFESRHNSKYWLLEPVFGFGVSAHSFDGRFRFSNERDTNRYVSLVESGDSPEVYREETDLALEFAFLGLRMMSGIDLDEYKRRFGIDLLEARGREIERLTSLNLLERAGNRLKLTVKGALFSNEVFQEFV